MCIEASTMDGGLSLHDAQCLISVYSVPDIYTCKYTRLGLNPWYIKKLYMNACIFEITTKISDDLNSVHLRCFLSCAITLISKWDVPSLRDELQGLNNINMFYCCKEIPSLCLSQRAGRVVKEGGWEHPGNPDPFTDPPLPPYSQEPTAGSVRRVNRYTEISFFKSLLLFPINPINRNDLIVANNL